jgi:hypothetical protein
MLKSKKKKNNKLNQIVYLIFPFDQMDNLLGFTLNQICCKDTGTLQVESQWIRKREKERKNLKNFPKKKDLKVACLVEDEPFKTRRKRMHELFPKQLNIGPPISHVLEAIRPKYY